MENPRTPAEKRRVLDNELFPRLARTQHEYAMVIRHLLEIQGKTITVYAESIAESPGTIGRMLCGATVMRPDDIERADRELGCVHALLRIWHQRQQNADVAAQIRAIKNGRWSRPSTADVPAGLWRAARIA